MVISGNAGTVTTAGSLTATIGGAVDFTCTYTLDSDESVYPGSISWQVKTGSAYNQSINPPGSGGSNAFTAFATDYKNRTKLFNITADGANSFVVVMRINEVLCSDEQHYRCSVLFVNSGSGPVTKTKETTLTARTPAEQPYEIPVPVPDNIEENMEVTFSCTANVGKPPGQIRWWRYRKGITAHQESGVFTNTPQIQEGECVYNVTSTVTYTMTKDDDQSVWRCFVDNELLTMPDRDKPNQESKRVNVFFKVNVPRIRKVPDTGANSEYFVGSSVTLICEAEGNPAPGIHTNTAVNRYLWTFKASPNNNASGLSSNNGTLTLTNLLETDTGTYTCTAFNGFNGKFFNASKDFSLQISTCFQVSQSKLEMIVGGMIGGVVLAALVAHFIFNRKYQILCVERKPNQSAQYEELKQITRDQENGYDVIRPPNRNGSHGGTYEELQHRKEEHRYEELSDPKNILNNGRQQNKVDHGQQTFGPPTTQSYGQSQQYGQGYRSHVGYSR
ncbi:LOW QUALITY PROTEIN: cell adhesion molecule 3-like [Saccostrea echinata]|uniref:LOW QUALITY PROTEIN: cell adhesion molecule 3-like n=1 Tax=Saccostrea echinata TaxID=191078 RepID=UPI002A805DC7|nr:LOW QUALITY PROTEIN: cell adhesion molecule 3-like [Saccostrea echinata]